MPWNGVKDWGANVLASADMDTYVSANTLYLYGLLNYVICFADAVVCHENEVVWFAI